MVLLHWFRWLRCVAHRCPPFANSTLCPMACSPKRPRNCRLARLVEYKPARGRVGRRGSHRVSRGIAPRFCGIAPTGLLTLWPEAAIAPHRECSLPAQVEHVTCTRERRQESKDAHRRARRPPYFQHFLDGRIHSTLTRSTMHAQLSVTDTGVGIPNEFAPHVFQAFRQAEASATRAVNGMGLGLTLVARILDLHGGTVHAESPGRGRGRPSRGNQTSICS
ncbi:MAG: ATP-binding protein [Planctomycetes bacterium]|nr:ATP-binding protein [Planctomycetota bacterium]